MAAGGVVLAEVGSLPDNRFAYLLQPIRDLASNWDIDIASELEDYLDELERIGFMLEDAAAGVGEAPPSSAGDAANSQDPRGSLNFAEAALLIQGTTCVYSKKVEYLHNLVYQALEAIFSKKGKDRAKKQGSDAAGAGGNGADADSDRPWDDQERFLSLDNTVLPGSNIDLADSKDGGGDEAAVLPALRRAPAALLALEDYSAAAAAAAGAGGNSGVALGDPDDRAALAGCRLAQCHVHESGALLLEASDGTDYDRHLRALTAGGQPPGIDAHNNQGENMQQTASGRCAEQQPASGPWDQALPNEQQEDFGNAMLDPDAGDAPGQDDDDCFHAPPPTALEERRDGFDGTNAEEAEAAQLQEEEEVEYFDPYKPLDMHAPGTLVIQPIQIRKASRAWKDNAKRGLNTKKSTSSSFFFPEFEYVVARTKQRASKQPCRLADARQQRNGLSVLDEADCARCVEQEQQLPDADDDIDGQPPAASRSETAPGVTYEGDGEGEEHAAEFGHDLDSDSDNDALGFLDLEPVDNGAPGMRALPLLQGGEASVAGGERSYEELCRSHIEALIVAAAAQQVRSDLSIQVSSWRDKIDPILREEESRSSFDIHVYGGQIMDRLHHTDVIHDATSKGDAVPFAQVCPATTKSDVCRTFAALLQLVNNVNVAVIQSGGPEKPFQLQVLNAELPFRSLSDKVANSGEVFVENSLQSEQIQNKTSRRAPRPTSKRIKKH